MRIFIFAILIALANFSFGQKEKLYDEFYLNLYNKDSLKVVVLSTAKFLKSFDYKFSNDTLYVDAKLTIVNKNKNINTVIKLQPKTNYINLNKEMYYIEPNYTFTIPSYRIVKQTKPEDKNNSEEPKKKK
jgi:hypothetical protein